MWRALNPPLRDRTHAAAERTVDAARRAIVIGYGPTGRTVVRLLRDSGDTPYLLLHGPEPDNRWEAFARAVIETLAQPDALKESRRSLHNIFE